MNIKENAETLKACRYCPMCRHVCTSGNISYHESDYPRGRGLILDNIYEGRAEYEPDFVDAVYNCCICGLCWSNCQGGYMPHRLILSSRKDIHDAGRIPDEVREMVDRIESGVNPYGDASAKYGGREKKAAVLYFMGDYIKYNGHAIAESVTGILERSGESYAILEDEPTDGKIMALLGFKEKARKAAEILGHRLDGLHPETIVVSDPLSYDFFKNDLSAYGIGLDAGVLHISEYLDRAIDSKKIRVSGVKHNVTLADSEFLGRFNGIFDPPRRVLKAAAGRNFIEMGKNRDKALATGEAAFIFNRKPLAMGKMIGSRLCMAARETGADIVVTLSGIAKRNMQECLDMDIFEISEFIWQNIK